METFDKKTKKELKGIFISILNEIEVLHSWSKENGTSNEFESLIINSSYLEDRHLKNPDDIMHKFLKKENYLLHVKELSTLVQQLEDIKSNLIQKDAETSEKSNSNQKRGGKREGAGRKGFGVTKKVSLTLDENTWHEINLLCEGKGISQSKAFREIIEKGINNQI